jgi:hypothetical protein
MIDMIQSFLNKMLGCSHHRTTFPQTPARKNGVAQAPGATRNGTYIVCLDCGKEFAYNWSEMRMGQPVTSRVVTPAGVTAEIL